MSKSYLNSSRVTFSDTQTSPVAEKTVSEKKERKNASNETTSVLHLATASLQNLYRIFTVPEAPNTTLGAIDKEISDNLIDFLSTRIVAKEKALAEIEQDFSQSEFPEEPQFVSDYTDFVMDKLVAHSVHTAAPGFIGHMATPLPNFMLPLSRIMVALNQNLVKIETSKAFTPLERQVLGMLHGMVYQMDESFYQKNLHNSRRALGVFCSGGTIANITALWVARNTLFKANNEFKGLAKEGIAAAMRYKGYERLVIIGSERCHYSLAKAADVLGIGRDNVILIPADAHSKINIEELKKTCRQLEQEKAGIVALIGVAGTTENGAVDPLNDMAEVANSLGVHFHVDAAWGGPTLMSATYRHLLSGIERADSVTIDAHKQLYVPMGAGMVVFKEPTALSMVEHHAEYILRAGSKDLGQYSLEGSRSGMAMLVHAAFHIIGRQGYELLIDQNIQKAKKFSQMIQLHADFELVAEPELNILNYRYVPKEIQTVLITLSDDKKEQANLLLDTLNQQIQKIQRAAGKTFVSRTRFTQTKYHHRKLSVFRVVLANPMTELTTLKEILKEQTEIVKSDAKSTRIIAELKVLINTNIE